MPNEDNLFKPEEPKPTETPPVDNQSSGEPNTPPEPVNLFEDHLKKITNPEGQPKYDSIPKALDALDHSQKHITSLTEEKLALEKEVEKLRDAQANKQSVEEVLERLTAMNAPTGSETPPQSGLDEEAVHKLVQSALNKEKQNSAKTENLTRVHETLTQKFGEKAREVINQKATELGTTPEQLGSLSAENPNLVLALFGTSTSTNSNPTSSSMRIPAGSVEPEPLAKPEKSLLFGATSKQQAEYMAKIKEAVYRKHNVQT